MDKPAPPPEAVLLALVLAASGMKAGDAADEVARRFNRKFSASRWSQIQNGYETRDGKYKRITATAATLAQMFAVVGGVTPERLAEEGQRPDAAEILREILHAPPEPPSARAAGLKAVPGPLTLPDDPTDEEVQDFILDQESPYLRRILMRTWRTESIPRKTRVDSIRAVAEAEASRPAEGRERRREPGA